MTKHAPLGLMLLAILARAHAIVGTATDDDTSCRNEQTKSFAVDGELSSVPDRGVAVSRLGPDATCAEKDDDDVIVEKNKEKDKKNKVKKKKRRHDDALSSLFSSLA
ncbi:hypothetical protein CP533_0963 [Ophiocordyceps camponoti-saundersi (nom. inval.)]|nr:hypothetical protein CP533_0963 [Ophiocordyceps camponoti-saundersi (nom. inval.)]